MHGTKQFKEEFSSVASVLQHSHTNRYSGVNTEAPGLVGACCFVPLQLDEALCAN